MPIPENNVEDIGTQSLRTVVDAMETAMTTGGSVVAAGSLTSVQTVSVAGVSQQQNVVCSHTTSLTSSASSSSVSSSSSSPATHKNSSSIVSSSAFGSLKRASAPSANQPLKRLKAVSSPVWDFFVKRTVVSKTTKKSEERAFCNHCHQHEGFLVGSRNSTSNLWRHLRDYHKELVCE
jgi:hypothetical protein